MRRLVLALALAALVLPAGAQQADSVRTLVQIEVRDGSTYLGDVISEDATTLQLRTVSGTLVEIAVSEIESRRTVKGRVRDGRFIRFDPNRTRLYFAPTARPLDKGQAYFADYWLFLGFVGVGITDRVTLAGGTLLFPESWGDFFMIAPKATLYQDSRQSAGLGVLTGFITEDWIDDGIGTFGIAYGVYTRGQPDRAITVGAGFAFAEGEFANSPTLMVGGEKGLSRRTKFITENWIFPSAEFFLYSFGLRFYGSRLAADVALVGASEGVGLWPWIGFAYNFGK